MVNLFEKSVKTKVIILLRALKKTALPTHTSLYDYFLPSTEVTREISRDLGVDMGVGG